MAEPPRVEGTERGRAVAVAFAAMATTYGIAYSFGAFLLPVSEDLGAGRGAGRGATAGISP